MTPPPAALLLAVAVALLAGLGGCHSAGTPRGAELLARLVLPPRARTAVEKVALVAARATADNAAAAETEAEADGDGDAAPVPEGADGVEEEGASSGTSPAKVAAIGGAALLLVCGTACWMRRRDKGVNEVRAAAAAHTRTRVTSLAAAGSVSSASVVPRGRGSVMGADRGRSDSMVSSTEDEIRRMTRAHVHGSATPLSPRRSVFASPPAASPGPAGRRLAW